jgi:hypothetical protein
LANEDSKKENSEASARQEDSDVRASDPILRAIPPQERDSAWALWQKAARSSAESMFEDCNYWISRLRPGKRGLTAEECFHLWSYLGELRFHLWSNTLPKIEARQIDTRSKVLEQELSDATRRISPYAKASVLLARLETEMLRVIQGIRHHIQEAERLLKKHDLAKSWDDTEFDYYIQTPMDRIGYTLELLNAMKIHLSARAHEALQILERDLRGIFHEAVHEYREFGDRIDGGRPVWPESFWWRHNDSVPPPNSLLSRQS